MAATDHPDSSRRPGSQDGPGLLDTLAVRQALLTLVLILLTGLVTGTVELYSAWQTTRERVVQRLDRTLDLTRGAATEAAYQLNTDLARQVVTGLERLQPVAYVVLEDNFGERLADAGPLVPQQAGPMARLLFGDLERRGRVLHRESVNGDRQAVGRLVLRPDTAAITRAFVQRAWRRVLAGAAGALGLALLVAGAFWFVLTRPLARMSRAVATVDPAHPGAGHVAVPRGHGRDEIGLLANNFNNLLAAFQDGLDRRDAAESELQAVNRDLEERVAARTRDLQEANEELETANNALISEKDETERAYAQLDRTHRDLEAANHRLMQSIQYARRIQTAMLPAPDAAGDAMRNFSVFWEPLDVVGGDFYWLERTGNRVVFFVADCTGHGVPGAFMTLVVAAALAPILRSPEGDRPSAILRALDTAVRRRLRQDRADAESDDGLDAAVAVWDPDTASLTFAGAGLPLLRQAPDGTVTEIRGNRAFLGYSSVAPASAFTEHTVTAAPGARFFLLSDGVTDQMGGGEPPRLLGRRRLRDIIENHAHKPLDDQMAAIRADLDAWRGDEPCRDDMTLIGLRPR